MEAIKIKEVSKSFGDLEALKKASLSIGKGQIFGLLGPNGAGKSTLINIISGLLRQDSGVVEIFGKTGDKKIIGVTPQENSFYEELSVWENLVFFGHMYGVPGKKLNKRVEGLIRSLELWDKKDTPAGYLSGGMKKRLSVGCSLVHEPKILILDEPTVGLDPDARQVLWRIVQDTHKKGVTIIITTHYMDEADFLCDRIAIMHRGNVIAIGKPSELKNLVGEDVIEIKTSPGESNEELLSFAKIIPAVSSVGENVGKPRIRTKKADEVLPKLIKYANKINEKVVRVNVRKTTLEDVFMTLTQEKDEKPSLKESDEKLGRTKVEEGSG